MRWHRVRRRVRDDLRDYVVEHPGGPDGMWAVDETGFVAYASRRGRALVDWELVCAESWTADRDRCAAAGISAEVELATKPQSGSVMLTCLCPRGRNCGWSEAKY
jgi:DDE superfamily endonuclease